MPAMTERPFEAHTTQRFPLGFEYVEEASRDTNTLYGVGTALPANSGQRVWVYVFNDDASNAFAQGNVVYRPSGQTNTYFGATITPAGGNPIPRIACIGVAQFAIAVGSYGFVLKHGVGEVSHGTADITTHTALTTGGSAVGTCIDWADGATTSEHIIAYATEGATAASGTVTAHIDCGG